MYLILAKRAEGSSEHFTTQTKNALIELLEKLENDNTYTKVNVFILGQVDLEEMFDNYRGWSYNK